MEGCLQRMNMNPNDKTDATFFFPFLPFNPTVTLDVLPFAATEIIVYGHRTSGNTNFWF